MIFEVTLCIILLSNQSVHPFVRSLVCSFARLFIRSFVRSFVVYSVVCSFRHVVHSIWIVEHYIQDLSGCILNLQKVSVYGMWITQVVCVQYFSYPFKMVYLFYSCIFFRTTPPQCIWCINFFRMTSQYFKDTIFATSHIQSTISMKIVFWNFKSLKILTTFYIKIKFA